MEESRVAALVGQIPNADTPDIASTFTGPAPEVAEKLFAEVLEGGPNSIMELIDMIRDPAERGYQDFKPVYVLHGLAIHVGREGREAQREMFAKAVASKIGGEKPSKAVQGFLIRELQVAGGREVAGVLGKQLLDAELCDDAAMALIAIREGAQEELTKALPVAAGKCKLAVVQALGVLRDAGSVDALLEAAGDQDRGVRIAAAWALGNIGDPRGADAVLKASGAEDGWERTQAAKACLVLAERLGVAGKKAEAARIYTRLRDTKTDSSEAYIREAAERGLAAGAS